MRFSYLGGLCLLAGTAVADTGPSTTLAVSGSITPGVCHVTFENGGALDFNGYGYHDLDDDEWTRLPPKGIRLDVNCGRSTAAMLDVIDNIADPSNTAEDKFSLGFQGEQSIGWYSVGVSNLSHDERTSVFIRQQGDSTWMFTNSLAKNTQHAWAVRNPSPQPVAFSNARVTLTVTPNIVPRKQLDTAQPLNLQGSMSIALRYP